MQRWEYLVTLRYYEPGVDAKPPEYEAQGKKYKTSEDMLNNLGEQGWELVSVYGEMRGAEYSNFYYLKRPKE